MDIQKGSATYVIMTKSVAEDKNLNTDAIMYTPGVAGGTVILST